MINNSCISILAANVTIRMQFPLWVGSGPSFLFGNIRIRLIVRRVKGGGGGGPPVLQPHYKEIEGPREG